jgi:hypothetical protein
VNRYLLLISERMLLLLVVAAVAGALLPGAAPILSPLVPLDLAVMVAAPPWRHGPSWPPLACTT